MSLKAVASRPISLSAATTTCDGASPSRMRWAAPVRAWSGRTSRTPANTEAPTVSARTRAATPVIFAVFPGDRSKPGTSPPPGSLMKSRAGEATYELSCSWRAMPTQEAMSRSLSLSRGAGVATSVGMASLGTLRLGAGVGTGTAVAGRGSSPVLHDRSRSSSTASRPCRSRHALTSSLRATSALASVPVGRSSASVEHRLPSRRSGSFPTTCMRGRPLGPSTTSEAIPVRLRHCTASSAVRRSEVRSASDSSNGPTARGSTRSVPGRCVPSVPGAAIVTEPAPEPEPEETSATDNGSTTADAWGGRLGGGGEEPAESARICRLCVVSVILRSDASASSSTVAPTPSQVGCRAA